MNLKIFLLCLCVVSLAASGCSTAKKTVKAADQWVQENIW